jgi:hypothetical protein
MAMAIDGPTTSARSERGSVFRFVGRLFREKRLVPAGGVIFVLFRLCGLAAMRRADKFCLPNHTRGQILLR